MPINAHPDYIAAEGEYLKAQTPEEKIEKLKKMISVAPSHKGAENLRKQLRSRLKKLTSELEKKKKKGGKKSGIKKEDLQAVIVGLENSGKSSILKLLTNAHIKISPIPFSTTQPIVGMTSYEEVPIQLIENPAIDSEYFDKGIINTADTLIITISKMDDLKKIENSLGKTNAKRIIAFNKSDLLSKEEKRKISARLQSKRYNFTLFSTLTLEGLEELKEKIFESFSFLRIYTKEPGKDRSPKPVIMKPHSNVSDVAEKILKGFSKKIKQSKIWGPSSKFGGQIVGPKHVLKDLDTVEFKTN